MADGLNILVLAQAEDGKPTAQSLEMLGGARSLADAEGGSVAAVLFGSGLGDAGPDLIAHGADRVTVFDSERCEPYRADAWLPDLARIAGDSGADLILIGHNSTGGDLAPRLAFRLDGGIATGCEAVAVEDGKIMQTRACYGGKAREVVSFATGPSVATVKPKSMAPLARDDARTGEVESAALSVGDGDIRTKVVAREREESAGQRLENAKTIVAGGGGLGGPAGFEAAAALAEALGGAVGASRVACDQGWCPPGYQIGLSGKTVAPELYIAVGISGAGQHMAGCSNAKTIVTINNDADAPIFNFSKFGVVGGYEELLPALTEEIAKLKG
jgi:electron transfer flavoprotein alpha subunit